VKIFSNDEFGARKPVTSFISPITCRWLETPRHAARFVSLIDFAPNQRIGDSRYIFACFSNFILKFFRSLAKFTFVYECGKRRYTGSLYFTL
jgi:hypothetical protein